MAGLYFGSNWNAEATEPCFQVTSAVPIIGVARMDDVAHVAKPTRCTRS